ncbi:MAG: glycogen-binding domain-containing protein, partial [Oligoflexus sp.]
MHKTETGWEIALHLGPGVHQYKFIADGKWMVDPANPLHLGEA